MADVTLSNLVKTYPPSGKNAAVEAVKSISLEIRDKEFMVLVGPSGCGKSTTLRMVAGLEEITSGEIRIGERVVNDVQPKDRDIAMVFQNYALYPHMTVFDNMAFGLKLKRRPKDEIQRRVHEAAAILGIEDLLHRRPKALAGGQRQRVAVGRAIVRNPKVFLFDEPLSNLDAKMRVSMRTEISRLHVRLGATMIYVTHDQVEAMTMGDRICVMKDGLIQQVAAPLELYNHPVNMFVAGFIGSPPMNFFKGSLLEEKSGIWFAEQNSRGRPVHLRLNDRLARAAARHINKKVHLGIRPEDLLDTRTLETPQSELCACATVEVAEPMGAETLLYSTTGEHTFIARVHADHSYAVDQPVQLQFNLEKAHLFDSTTECVLPA